MPLTFVIYIFFRHRAVFRPAKNSVGNKKSCNDKFLSLFNKNMYPSKFNPYIHRIYFFETQKNVILFFLGQLSLSFDFVIGMLCHLCLITNTNTKQSIRIVYS